MAEIDADIQNTYRNYYVEVRAYSEDGEAPRLDNRWYPKGQTRLEPGADSRKEARRLSKLHGTDVRLILKHPVPHHVFVTTAINANLKGSSYK